MEFDAVIIGAGACGLMCAAQAGLLGKRVLVVERNSKPGAKILISGGGRCNYTNLHTSIDNFVTENSDFLHSAFNQWTVDDTISFFEGYGSIQGAEKTLGQLFPTSNKAKDIVDVFLRLMNQTKQVLWLDSLVKGVKQVSPGFEITIERQGAVQQITTKKVVMASGGLPVQKLGASDFALRVARDLGHRIVRTAPALVPLTITGKDAAWYAALSGNSLFARVWNERISFEENILFTHWGLSGPAILQISTYWQAGETFSIDLLPRHRLDQLIKEERQQGGKRTVAQLLQDHFSKKLVEAMGEMLPLTLKIASLSKADAQRIFDIIHRFPVKPAGDKGYDKAEVMSGGVATDEINAKTMESNLVKGLYFGGEAVDITGWLGGYNFQWAWASGYAIAQAI
ncbi:NAD(P)/FAD-dependent oxidoreductase [Sphingobacterium sp. lm-10]|uniref:NAD(P)/FAD-dependent oxidoreductase n=1 Tax=Sphingobacterium sp. lm-10 TaxID=2944904 RepID=UPI0020218470|nr:aminoacetone oxidase family FAD-binding enzyme [Sphingobacterium sp. lm-10]MCL7986411.1 NAD(P)/FAD-dependent oxidoreductase [Sphingobacterium sp. lm-10]